MSERTVNVALVSRLSLPADRDAVYSLPAPEETALEGAAATELATCLPALREAWLHLLLDGSPDPLIDELSPSRWERLVNNVGRYFAFVVERVLAAEPKDVEDPVAFELSDSYRILDAAEELVQGSPEGDDGALNSRFTAINITSNFIIGLLGAYFSRVAGRVGALEAAHHIDAVAHESLQRMHQKEVTSTRHRALTSRLLATLLSIVGDTYEERARSFQWRLTGPFSALELGDLPQLARRSEPMRKKYGDKQVETIFEQQLALLMQSLGFVVVQTRRGRRTVDLVAIADGPDDRFTFLVEAKTTAASTYPFPADDQRALAEYARSVRSTLTTMPTMRFVLLISHTASRTMPEKVTAFEAAHSVPLRFLPVEELVALRELVPGPPPLQPLSKEVLEGPPVLEPGFGRSVAEAYERRHRAHNEFVQAMLSGDRPLEA